MLKVTDGKVDLEELKQEIEREREEMREMQEHCRKGGHKSRMIAYIEHENALHNLKRRLFGND